MKKTLKLLSVFIVTILLSGCFLLPQTPNNNSVNQPVNTNPSTGNPNANPLVVSDEVNVYVRGGMYDSGTSFNPNNPTYQAMAKSVCEYEGTVFLRIGNGIYKQNQDGDTEKVFESDSPIYSFLGVWKDKIVYVKENGKDQRDFYLSTFWVYDSKTGLSKQITDSDYTSYYSIVYENYLIAYDGRLLFYDIENDDLTFTTDISDKTEEEWQNYLPESFEAKIISTGGYYSEVGLYKIENDQKIQIGLSPYIVDNNYLNFDKVGDRFCDYKWVYRDKSVYVISVYPIVTDSHSPLPGTNEICDTVNWEKDILSTADKNNLNPVNVQNVYEDGTNRIIGYNPDTNEVYLYNFLNNTIVSKNLDDKSETVTETLKEADTIEFEWCDTRLYWFYVNKGIEEYGGVHEFAGQ